LGEKILEAFSRQEGSVDARVAGVEGRFELCDGEFLAHGPKERKVRARGPIRDNITAPV